MMGFEKIEEFKYKCITCGAIVPSGIITISSHWCECTGKEFYEALKTSAPLTVDKVDELREKHLSK